jgi:hypothetical protein
MATARDNARQQLAGKNAKPRDLNRVMGQTDAQRKYEGEQGSATASDNSIVERDGNVVYRYSPKYDYTTIEREDGTSSAPMRGNQLPSNSMDAYIDKVAGMAGMTGQPSQPANIPVPMSDPRDESDGVVMTGTEGNPGKLKDDEIAEGPQPASEEANEGSGLLGLLGIGGLGVGGAALVKYLMSQNANAASPDVNSVVDTGNLEKSQAANNEGMPNAQITKEDRLALPPPPKALPSPTEQMIDEVDGNPQSPEQRMLEDGDMPQRRQRPELPQAANGSVPPEIVDQLKQAMDSGNARQAIQIMRQNNIQIDDDLIRMLSQASNTAKSLAKRAAESVAPTVRNVVRP